MSLVRPSPGWLAVLTVAVVACEGPPPPDEPAVTTAALSAEDLPVVDATLDGRPLRMLVDTGAEATIVSSRWLAVDDQRWVAIGALCFADHCVRPLRVWAADTPFSQPEPGAINGIIGMDPLGRFVLELDRGRLRLDPPRRRCRAPAQALAFDEFGRPLLEVRIDRTNIGPTLLDTGALYTLLSAELAASAPYLAKHAAPAGACGIGGCTTTGSFVSRVRRACVGDTCLSRVPVKYPAWNAIGNSFLRHFVLRADFPNATVQLCRRTRGDVAPAD